MTCDHYCNESLRCPSCIRRFWVWAQNHTRGRVPKGKPTASSFYEAAALWIDVDARSTRAQPPTSYRGSGGGCDAIHAAASG
jgi:hypothetical protein